MNPRKAAFFLFALVVFTAFAFPQLRNLSQYEQDRIHPEKTYFILKENGDPEFGWASEWTHATANAVEGKAAIFVWIFKGGSKAYSVQAEDIGEIGKNAGYLLENKSAALEDVHRKKIQPLTRDNYPVRIELWLGKIDDAGFTLETQGDAVCLQETRIEFGSTYHFAPCTPDQ